MLPKEYQCSNISSLIAGTAKDLSTLKAIGESDAGPDHFSVLDNILDIGVVINEKAIIHFFNRKVQNKIQLSQHLLCLMLIYIYLKRPKSSLEEREKM